MDDKLLKEFVAGTLAEAISSGREHFSMSSYSGVPAHDDFMRTFVLPFTDVFDTATATVLRLGHASGVALQKLMSGILYTMLPDVIARSIVPRVDEIIHKEQVFAKAIEKKYADVFERNTHALFSGDAAMFAFLAEPAAFLASALLIKSYEGVNSLLQSLHNTREFQQPQAKSSLEKAITHLRALRREKTRSEALEQARNVRPEGLLRERNEAANAHIIAIQQILHNLQLVKALDATLDKPRRDVAASLTTMERELTRDINDVVYGNNEGLVNALSAQLASSDELDEANLDALKPALEQAVQAGLRTAYKNVIKQRVATAAPNHKRIFEKILTNL